MRRQTAKDGPNGQSEPADAAASSEDGPDAAKRSRRDFFRYGGTAAAGALLGGAVGGAIGFARGERSGFLEAENDYGALAPRRAPGFDHVVVVMGENRSFDNLLGYLYSNENLPDGQSFDGLAFGEYYNVAADGTRVDAHVYEGATDKIMAHPDPDPGEEYPHVNTQIFNTVEPAGNAKLFVESMQSPYNTPQNGEQATMSGFLNDYIINFERLKKGAPPTVDEAKHIMGSFSPEMLPTLSTLAREFAVFDNWYCAVPSQTFCNRSFAQEPMLQSQSAMYAALPMPAQDGRVFAGWYTSAEAAAAYQTDARVNGSETVACTDQRMVLHGAWMSPEENAAADAQIPILMYHQFTSRPEGEDGWLRGNYAYIGDFDAHMNYIATSGFYLPTWDELSAFIDGRLFLPNRSVIVTDDDADQTWFDLAVPVVDEYKMLSTSFMITAYRQDPQPSSFVLRRSHTHDMHQAGANGQGRMVNWTAEEIAADLNASGDVLGAREVAAYPFGHYDDTTKEGVAMAGYEMRGRSIRDTCTSAPTSSRYRWCGSTTVWDSMR